MAETVSSNDLAGLLMDDADLISAQSDALKRVVGERNMLFSALKKLVAMCDGMGWGKDIEGNDRPYVAAARAALAAMPAHVGKEPPPSARQMIIDHFNAVAAEAGSDVRVR